MSTWISRYFLGVIPAGRDGTQNIVVIPSMDVQPPEQIKGGQGMLDPVIPPIPALVMLSGESSAGKTVLAYNIAYHLAEGITFGGMKPPQQFPVLYFDLESPDVVHSTLVHKVGRSENLHFVRGLPRTLDIIEGQRMFLAACRGYRVIILDPLPIAWPVDDENDNAKADRQISTLKR
ncbi:MAG: AAA family ATPase, partial [Candidatus Krumholzibacteriota bacterium]|nr:AAA family ATPase [Candidatus Krumholzibacteriota bacterium]